MIGESEKALRRACARLLFILDVDVGDAKEDGEPILDEYARGAMDEARKAICAAGHEWEPDHCGMAEHHSCIGCYQRIDSLHTDAEIATIIGKPVSHPRSTG